MTSLSPSYLNSHTRCRFYRQGECPLNYSLGCTSKIYSVLENGWFYLPSTYFLSLLKKSVHQKMQKPNNLASCCLAAAPDSSWGPSKRSGHGDWPGARSSGASEHLHAGRTGRRPAQALLAQALLPPGPGFLRATVSSPTALPDAARRHVHSSRTRCRPGRGRGHHCRWVTQGAQEHHVQSPAPRTAVGPFLKVTHCCLRMGLFHSLV